MGQHKHNPTAQLAGEGKLPPKKRKRGKRTIDRLLQAIFATHLQKSIGYYPGRWV